MVVDGVVADGDARAVERPRVTIGHVVERHAHHAVHAPPLAVVGQVGQPVRRVEFVVSDAEAAVSQLVLDVVDEAQGLLPRRFEGRCALGMGKFHHVEVDVVALLGPVDHVFASRHTAVFEHPVGAVHPFRREVVTPGELRGVVARRPLDGSVRAGPVVLEDGHHREVLHRVVGLGRSQLFARVGAGVHAKTV